MIDTAGSSYDTILTLFGDAYCSRELTCNDDSPNFPPQSIIQQNLTAGVNYTVVVSAYLGDYGGHTVRVFLASNTIYYPPPQNVTVQRISHGLCFGTYCDCDQGWVGSACNMSSSAAPSKSPTAPSAPPLTSESFALSDIGCGFFGFLFVVFFLGQTPQ